MPPEMQFRELGNGYGLVVPQYGQMHMKALFSKGDTPKNNGSQSSFLLPSAIDIYF